MHELIVTRLRCGLCGAELPVMGRAVTFRCGTCRATWIIAGDGLKEIPMLRAACAPERCRRPLWLPFWVIEIDLPHLTETFSGLVSSLREKQALIASRNSALAETALPPAAELDRFLNTISEHGTYRVYVPAFDSPAERARLSIGRLMTLRRPAASVEDSDGSGESAPCVICAGDAGVLCRYVFFSIIPESIASCAGLTGELDIGPAAPPQLIEHPFSQRGAALECLSADFHISARHVAGRPAPAPRG